MTEAYFSPGTNPRDKIMLEINNAIYTLDIAQSYFTDQTIWFTIVDALSRGVIVRLLLDKHALNAAYSVYKLYIKGNVIPGLTTRISQIKGYMHNHFCVIDDFVLLTGSYNWTYLAGYVNDEDLLYVPGESIVSDFTTEFNRLWSNAI